MDPVSLATIVEWSGGELILGDPNMMVKGVSTDSRTIAQHELFVALHGENFDGHDFIPGVFSLGAVAAMIDRDIATGDLSKDQGLIRVEDTLKGLQQLAHSYRRMLPLQVVCITGSNGKTSTKDFTAAVLRRRFLVSATRGNLNNHIGLPLTVLRSSTGDQVGVWEIGMNHPGEIAPLAGLALPNIGVITNIGTAHIGLMGSREAIAQEKGMLAEALVPTGTLILSAEDDYSAALSRRTKADVVLCGIECGDVAAEDLMQDGAGTRFRIRSGHQTADAELPVPGRHMVQNALLAVAVGRTLGVSLEECANGLRSSTLTKGRLEQKVIRGVRAIDDTYNANPDSMCAALRVVADMPVDGRRIAVLGQMAELGGESEDGHRSVGKAAAELGFDAIISFSGDAAFIADEARKCGVRDVTEAANTGEAVELLLKLARPGDVVLVKGSRSSRMEQILEEWSAS